MRLSATLSIVTFILPAVVQAAPGLPWYLYFSRNNTPALYGPPTHNHDHPPAIPYNTQTAQQPRTNPFPEELNEAIVTSIEAYSDEELSIAVQTIMDLITEPEASRHPSNLVAQVSTILNARVAGMMDGIISGAPTQPGVNTLYGALCGHLKGLTADTREKVQQAIQELALIAENTPSDEEAVAVGSVAEAVATGAYPDSKDLEVLGAISQSLDADAPRFWEMD